jgi:hypothetical protein
VYYHVKCAPEVKRLLDEVMGELERAVAKFPSGSPSVSTNIFTSSLRNTNKEAQATDISTPQGD